MTILESFNWHRYKFIFFKVHYKLCIYQLGRPFKKFAGAKDQNIMDVKRRMMMIRVIEKMNKDKSYSQKLGLEDASRFDKRILEKESLNIQRQRR